MSRMLWLCPDCDGHEFVIVMLRPLPYTVVVLCARCGKEISELGDSSTTQDVKCEGNVNNG